MQLSQIRALLALLTSATLLLAAPARRAVKRLTHAQVPHRLHPRPPRLEPRLPADYTEWSRVAACESGGWRVLGYEYPDSLGINRANFIAFGGTPLSPGPVSRADRIMQIQAADRLIARYGSAIPDQYGCAAW